MTIKEVLDKLDYKVTISTDSCNSKDNEAIRPEIYLTAYIEEPDSDKFEFTNKIDLLKFWCNLDAYPDIMEKFSSELAVQFKDKFNLEESLETIKREVFNDYIKFEIPNIETIFKSNKNE